MWASCPMTCGCAPARIPKADTDDVCLSCGCHRGWETSCNPAQALLEG